MASLDVAYRIVAISNGYLAMPLNFYPQEGQRIDMSKAVFGVTPADLSANLTALLTKDLLEN